MYYNEYSVLDEYELNEILEEVMNTEEEESYENIKSQPFITHFIHELIEDLSFFEQDIICRKFWGDKSEDEIAKDMDICSSRVFSVLFEIYEHFKEQILDQYYSDELAFD